MSERQKELLGRQCAVIDNMPQPLRDLVHDYGFGVVVAFIENGVNSPNVIRHLIRAVRSVGQDNRGLASESRARGGALLAVLEPWLIQQGAGFPSRHLVQVVRDAGFTLLPRNAPSLPMVEASLAALDGRPQISKREKHLMRLQAALLAGDRAMWGTGT